MPCRNASTGIYETASKLIEAVEVRLSPEHLTFTAAEAVEAARAFPDAVIIPLHYEGWAHFSESRRQVEEAFAAAGLGHRLRWLEPGRATIFTT
jgi:L-ascorbate metabolism protein UlaG (beta-lactamase superfamily)